MKVLGLIDSEEEKEIRRLAKGLKKKTDWHGSGSMLIMVGELPRQFDVYLFRATVEFTKEELEEINRSK